MRAPRRTTIGALAGALALTLAGCGDTSTGGDGESAEADAGNVYTFEVSGPATADITYPSDGMGSSSQAIGAELPWTEDVAIEGDVIALTVLAQSPADYDGEITCRISQDGEVLEEQSSSGPAAIAQCTHEGDL